MKNFIKLSLIFLLISTFAYSQETGFTFTMKKEIPCTPVKNQSATNTCWCFSGISVFESELIRMGKKPYDLSEMYIVRHTYEKKAENYARMHGSASFSGGGEYGDLISGSREVGLMPDSLSGNELWRDKT